MRVAVAPLLCALSVSVDVLGLSWFWGDSVSSTGGSGLALPSTLSAKVATVIIDPTDILVGSEKLPPVETGTMAPEGVVQLRLRPGDPPVKASSGIFMSLSISPSRTPALSGVLGNASPPLELVDRLSDGTVDDPDTSVGERDLEIGIRGVTVEVEEAIGLKVVPVGVCPTSEVRVLLPPNLNEEDEEDICGILGRLGDRGSRSDDMLEYWLIIIEPFREMDELRVKLESRRVRGDGESSSSLHKHTLVNAT